MPLIKPKNKEEKTAFISRCMSNKTMLKEFPDETQRVAVCNNQWRTKKVKKSTDMNEEFKYFIKIEKSPTQAEDGKIIIEGVATGLEVDADGERMTEEVIKDFNEAINSMAEQGEPMPLTDGHPAKGPILGEIGDIIGAEILKNNDLKIKAALDAQHPAVPVLLRKLSEGKKFAFSIEGYLQKAKQIFDEKLGTFVRVYEKLLPKAITVTSEPSYYPSFIEVVAKAYKDNQEKVLKATFDEELNNVYKKYNELVNMSATELETWSSTEDSKLASVTRKPIKRNLKLLRKKKSEWTEKDVADANKTISFISRMRKAEQGQKLPNSRYSKRDISLKNWGHDPVRKSMKELRTLFKSLDDKYNIINKNMEKSTKKIEKSKEVTAETASKKSKKEVEKVEKMTSTEMVEKMSMLKDILKSMGYSLTKDDKKVSKKSKKSSEDKVEKSKKESNLVTKSTLDEFKSELVEVVKSTIAPVAEELAALKKAPLTKKSKAIVAGKGENIEVDNLTPGTDNFVKNYNKLFGKSE